MKEILNRVVRELEEGTIESISWEAVIEETKQGFRATDKRIVIIRYIRRKEVKGGD